MDKIDRLGWAAGISFVSYGVQVGVRVNNPEILDRLVDRFPPGWKPSRSLTVERLYSLIVGGAALRPNVRKFNILYSDIAKLTRTLDLDEFLDTFESDLTLHIASNARRRVFVRAGVVGWRGQAILILGRASSGKTSLVTELVRSGAKYYSDEYAVLDAKGMVHPYAGPLSVRENGKRVKQPLEMLGGESGRKSLAVGLVIVSRYKPGARWRPTRLSSGEGALALIENTVSIQQQPEMAVGTLRQAISGAACVKGVRGEAKEVVNYVLESFAENGT